MKLAQKLDELNLPVHVGRADCTKFETLSSTFNIRGFPTIKYISHDKVIEYTGDRSLDELVDFATRMTGLVETKNQFQPGTSMPDTDLSLCYTTMYVIFHYLIRNLLSQAKDSNHQSLLSC